jgi:hypothetical protein
MDVQQVAAERNLHAVSPDGLWHEVTLTILMPNARSGGGWRAPIRLKGLEDRVHNVAGMDSWQALSLAMRFARARLSHFVENGWKLYWDREGTPFLLENLESASDPI